MKLLLYCTKAKPYLIDLRKLNCGFQTWECDSKANLNGKIVAECDFEVEEIIAQEYRDCYCTSINHMGDSELQKRSCLTLSQLCDYLGTKEYGSYELVKKVGYAIHIKNLHIFDEPKELNYADLSKAPQNMCYGWTLDNEYQLPVVCAVISIRPEWLCKILNGEKTIEVRRKVLKEMLK